MYFLNQTPKLMELRTPTSLTELSPFVENQAEISKETLLKRCTGKVSYRLLLLLKLMVFHRVGKDNKGQVYLA